MNTYLCIITTLLVLTQIIRMLQNAMQLRKYGRVQAENAYITSVYKKIENYIDAQDKEVRNANH